MAALLGVPQRKLAVWERGEDEPGSLHQGRLVDLLQKPPGELLQGLGVAVNGSLLPRALCRSERLNLLAVSQPAIEKRPTIVNWIGEDLLPIACGLLQSILDDAALQRAIMKREVASVVATSRSVLRTAESEFVGAYRTTINYFFHDGVLYNDAIAVPAAPDERIGFTPILVEETGADLFGDVAAIEAILAQSVGRPRGTKVEAA